METEITKENFNSELLSVLFDTQYLNPDEVNDFKPPIIGSYKEGKSPLINIVGNNASGKSFLRRLIQDFCYLEKIYCYYFSMEHRVGSLQQSPFIKNIIYGQEDCQSTGNLSSKVILNSIKNSKSQESKHIIIWDEPDIGLSDEWAAAAGREIAKYIESPSETFVGSIIISHSKSLLSELQYLNPSFVCVGEDQYESFDEWKNREIKILNLEDLQKQNNKRFTHINHVRNNFKKKHLQN